MYENKYYFILIWGWQWALWRRRKFHCSTEKAALQCPLIMVAPVLVPATGRRFLTIHWRCIIAKIISFVSI